MRRLLSMLLVLSVVLAMAARVSAQSETISLLCADPIQATINTLVANFEAKTGIHVNVTYGSGTGTRDTVANGGALDVSILLAPFPEALAKGNIDPKSATVIAQLRLALAVPKGAPKPDISTAAAARQALLNAKSPISVDPDLGSVGGAAMLALEKMGIAAQMKPRIKWVGNRAAVLQAVSKGENDLAIGPYLSDMRGNGFDVVGALPPDASTPIDITGFLSTSVKDPKAAKALLAYLSSHEVAPIYETAKIFPIH